MANTSAWVWRPDEDAEFQAYADSIGEYFDALHTKDLRLIGKAQREMDKRRAIWDKACNRRDARMRKPRKKQATK